MELRTLTLEKGGLDRFIALGFIMVMTYDTCFFFVKLIITHFFCLVNILYVSFSTFHQSLPKLRSSTNFRHLLGLHPPPEDYHDWLKKSTMNESMVM